MHIRDHGLPNTSFRHFGISRRIDVDSDSDVQPDFNQEWQRIACSVDGSERLVSLAEEKLGHSASQFLNEL